MKPPPKSSKITTIKKETSDEYHQKLFGQEGFIFATQQLKNWAQEQDYYNFVSIGLKGHRLLSRI